MKKKVSIVIPTFNRRLLLAQSLESCRVQTYTPIEIIVVDDCSADDTAAYVGGLQDERVIYIRQPVHGGSVSCLNAGFARAQGEYLTWLSDDDFYDPEAIEKMARELELSPEADFVYAHYWLVDIKGKIINAARVEDPASLDRDNYVGFCFLYRRKVYEVIGAYHAEPFLAEEYEYWLRIREKFGMKKIPATLCYHRIHAGSITAGYGYEKIQDAVARARRPYIAFWKHHFLVGERHYAGRRRFPAGGHVLLSLLARPWHWRSWRLLALVILPRQVAGWLRGGQPRN